MKTLKSIIILTVWMLAVAVTTSDAQRMTQRTGGPVGVMPAELLEQLQLTDEQKVALFDLRALHAKNLQSMREEFRTGDVSPNSMRTQREALQAEHDNQLKSILNAEQYETLVTYRKQRQESNRSMRGDRPGMRGQHPGMQGDRPSMRGMDGMNRSGMNRGDRPRRGN